MEIVDSLFSCYNRYDFQDGASVATHSIHSSGAGDLHLRSERVEFEVDGHRFLHEANRDQWPSDQLFQVMAQHVPKLYIPYMLTNTGKKRPLVSPGPSPKSQRMILFTDPEPAKALRLDQSVTLMERKALDLLRKAFRADYAGLVINPGDSSRRVINREEMLLLFREYAVAEGRRLGGGWVPTRGDKMLLVQLEEGTYTVTVYIDERDVREVCDSCGGEPVLHSWDVIHDRCLQAGANAPYVQFGFPEQVLLLSRHMNQLRGREPVQLQGQDSVRLRVQEPAQPQEEVPDRLQGPEPAQPQEEEPDRLRVQGPAQPQEEVPDRLRGPELARLQEEEPDRLRVQGPAQPQEEEPDRLRDPESVQPQEEEPDRLRVQEPAQPQEEVPDRLRGPEPARLQEEEPDRPQVQGPARLQEEVPDRLRGPEPARLQEEEPDRLRVQEPAQPKGHESDWPRVQGPARLQEEDPVRLRDKEQESPESRETKESLERLEQAVRRGQGWVNSREIIRRMTELRKIWVIVDPDGKPAFLDSGTRIPVVDFFTSRDHAIRLIQAFRQGGKELPNLEPRLVDARPLFKRLAAYEPIVWINRGAPEGWTSVSNHLLSAVLAEGFTDSGVYSGAEK